MVADIYLVDTNGDGFASGFIQRDTPCSQFAGGVFLQVSDRVYFSAAIKQLCIQYAIVEDLLGFIAVVIEYDRAGTFSGLSIGVLELGYIRIANHVLGGRAALYQKQRGCSQGIYDFLHVDFPCYCL